MITGDENSDDEISDDEISDDEIFCDEISDDEISDDVISGNLEKSQKNGSYISFRNFCARFERLRCINLFCLVLFSFPRPHHQNLKLKKTVKYSNWIS